MFIPYDPYLNYSLTAILGRKSAEISHGSIFPHVMCQFGDVICLVGGFKHGFYCPFHIWDVILPIDELHHFSGWLLHHQQDVILREIYIMDPLFEQL